MRNYVIFFIVFLVFSLSNVFAQETKDQAKQIIVEPKKLEVSIKPTKEKFKVGEEIYFNIKSNKKVYLYIFSVMDEDEVAAIFPNIDDKENRIEADKNIKLPKKSIFKSEREGKERFIFIASVEKISQLNMVERFPGKNLIKGDEAENFKKDIAVYQKPKPESELFMDELTIEIEGEEVVDEGYIFAINTDRTNYKPGDKITIEILSSKSGVVKLSYQNLKWESNRWEAIDTKEIKAGEKVYVIVDAVKPAGLHILKAELTEKKKGTFGKDLAISKKTIEGYAVFKILEK